MRILTFTSLYPNARQPSLAVFLHQRTYHLSLRPEQSALVVAPIPYFPSWLGLSRWRMFAQIPREERMGGLRVLHPRYPHLPRIGMPVHAFLMAAGCLMCVIRAKRQFDLECIDAHFVYPDGFAAVLLGRLLRIPVVISARGTDVNVYPSLRAIRPMIKWALRKCAGVIAVSNSLKEEMLKLGTPAEKIRVIPNGVDGSRFFLTSQVETRKRLSLPLETPIAVSVGALVDAKRHELMVRAIALLKERQPKLCAWIVGEGPLRQTLEALIRSQGLEGRVHLVGNKPNEELLNWFNAADISCLTSSREGWPNVVTESLACGTPVVGTRVGGIPEILHSPDLGILVDENPENVAEGIDKALRQSWNREWISRTTRARTWDTVASEVQSVLNACIRAENLRR